MRNRRRLSLATVALLAVGGCYGSPSDDSADAGDSGEEDADATAQTNGEGSVGTDAGDATLGPDSNDTGDAPSAPDAHDATISDANLDASGEGDAANDAHGGGDGTRDGSPDALTDAPDTAPPDDAGPGAGGPWVAFVSNRGGDYDIYIVHPDGGGLRPIVQATGTDLYPSWSPDGAKIAFASNRASGGANYQLYTVDVASGDTTPTPTNLSDAVTPAWSPDGTTLVFGGPGGLYVVPSGGGTATALTSGGFRDNTPAWSPDGQLIYFSSNRGDAGTTFDVWSVAPDGGNLRQVTTGTNILGGPKPSPDGATIALTQAVSGSSTTQIVFFSLATKATTVFTSLNDSDPAFSPSGTTLAATTTRYAVGNQEIVLLGVPGATSPFRLTNSSTTDGQPTFQPAH